MKHFDKENLIVIGIALAILIAWGVWYPQRQAQVNAKSRERQAAAHIQCAVFDHNAELRFRFIHGVTAGDGQRRVHGVNF